ncbi:MAG: putative zinc-finger [Actinomycetota bacterium]|nr:putative zinc-finger [Actinomycetota bacterium]
MSPHADTELLSAYLDGEVPTSERAGLEEHLASCPQCSARKSALEGVIRSVGGLPPVTTTEAEHLAIRRAVLEGAGARGPDWALKRARAWKIFAATAAVAAVVAGILSFVLVKASGPKVTSTASAPAPSASPALPRLATAAEGRSSARTQPGGSTYLGQGHAPAGAAGAPQAPLPAPTAPPAFAQVNPSAPKSDRANASGAATQAGPPTLGSCTRDAVLSGGALLGATPVIYQATPAWVIAYGAPSGSAGGSAGTLDRVVVEVRSQSSCSVLDQATLVP